MIDHAGGHVSVFLAERITLQSWRTKFWTRTSADKTATRPRDRVRRVRSESGRARMASASRPRPVCPARQVRRFKGPARRRPPPDRREFSLARRAPSAAVRRVRAGWSGGPAVPQGLLRRRTHSHTRAHSAWQCTRCSASVHTAVKQPKPASLRPVNCRHRCASYAEQWQRCRPERHALSQPLA